MLIAHWSVLSLPARVARSHAQRHFNFLPPLVRSCF